MTQDAKRQSRLHERQHKIKKGDISIKAKHKYHAQEGKNQQQEIKSNIDVKLLLLIRGSYIKFWFFNSFCTLNRTYLFCSQEKALGVH